MTTLLQPLPAQAERLSALADGELEASAAAQLLRENTTSEMHENWSAYHLIGNVLRAPGKGVEPPAEADFLAAFRLRLEQQQIQPAQPAQPAPLRLVAQPRQAANDAVFRWKLAAGFASLTAVCAVAWQMVGLPGDVPSQGQLLALGNPQRPSTQVVATPVGPVVRDSRMQELLAAHRQYGGTPAVQIPGPFLRNAVFAPDAQGQ